MPSRLVLRSSFAAVLLSTAAALPCQQTWHVSGVRPAREGAIHSEAGRYGRPAYQHGGTVLEWDGRAWEEQSRLPASFLTVPILIHDPARQQELAIHHRLNGTPPFETWIRSGAVWHQLPTPTPAELWSSRIRYFPPRGRLIAWNNVAVHEWDGFTWQPLAALPPVQMRDFATDPIRNVVVGIESQASGVAVHEWNGVTWQAVPTTVAPSSLTNLEWDAAGGAVFAYQRTGLGPPVECWHWDGTNWTQRTIPGGTVNRIAVDPANGTLRWFEGIRTDMVWNGSAWLPSPVLGGFSSSLQSMDDFRGRLVRVGAGTFEWDGEDWVLRAPSPVPLDFPGRLSFDWSSGDTILVGASGGAMQTWSWDGTTWSTLPSGVAPPARQYFALIRDAGNSRVVLFGGIDGSGQGRNDTWVWSNRGWVPFATLPSSTPSAGQCIGAESQSPTIPSAVVTGDELWSWSNGWTLTSNAQPLLVVEAATVAPDGSVLVTGHGTSAYEAAVFRNGIWQSIAAPPFHAQWVGAHPRRGVTLAMEAGFEMTLTDVPATDLVYGPGCGDRVPVILGEDQPRVPSAGYQVAVHTDAGAPVFLALSDQQVNLPLVGACSSWIGPILDLRFTIADPSGRAKFAMPVPFDPTLRGRAMFAQAVVLQPSSSLGVALSGGLRIQLGD